MRTRHARQIRYGITEARKMLFHSLLSRDWGRALWFHALMPNSKLARAAYLRTAAPMVDGNRYVP